MEQDWTNVEKQLSVIKDEYSKNLLGVPFDRQEIRIQVALAASYFENDKDKSIHLLENALQLGEPRFGDDELLSNVYGVLTGLYGKKGEYDKALAYFSKNIKLDHTVARGWFNIGDDFGRIAEDPEILRIFEEQYSLNPKIGILVDNLGVSYFHLKRYSDAERIYAECLNNFDEEYFIVLPGGGQELQLGACYTKLALAKYYLNDIKGSKHLLNEAIERGIDDGRTHSVINGLYPEGIK